MSTIDLHGFRYHEAKQELELFINEHWGKRLKVITGNSENMKNVVCEVIQQYNLDFFRDALEGFIIIIEH